jgi:GNAT superfamily N-acetyltransferase
VAHDPNLSPRGLWNAARALGDEPGLEWTFPLFTLRSLALEVEVGPEEPHGMDLYYEDLSTWQEALGVFAINRVLADGGLPPQWLYGMMIGMEMFESGYHAPHGRLPLPGEGDSYRGRHLVAVLDSTQDELVFANSWGPEWGDKGLGYISHGYFEFHVDSVFVTRPAWNGPSPRMDDALKRLSWIRGHGGSPRSVEDMVEAWTTPNTLSAKTIDRGRQHYQVIMRRTFSASGEMHPLDMIDLRDTRGRILGRTHILHVRDSPRSIITELFVAPKVRRKGIGRILTELAMERALTWRKERIELLLHEADASPSGLSRAISFGTACGFTWEGRSSRRPNVTNVAYRKVQINGRDH